MPDHHVGRFFVGEMPKAGQPDDPRIGYSGRSLFSDVWWHGRVIFADDENCPRGDRTEIAQQRIKIPMRHHQQGGVSMVAVADKPLIQRKPIRV